MIVNRRETLKSFRKARQMIAESTDTLCNQVDHCSRGWTLPWNGVSPPGHPALKCYGALTIMHVGYGYIPDTSRIHGRCSGSRWIYSDIVKHREK